jgi:hypothetical protein
VEIAENFQGINPGFEIPAFVAEESGSRSSGGDKFPGTIGTRKFKMTRLCHAGNAARKKKHQGKPVEIFMPAESKLLHG